MNIKVAFYKARGRPRDRFVRWWTNSLYSHVELLLADDKTLIGINPPDKPRVRKSVLGEGVNKRDWDFVTLSATEEQLANLSEFYEITKENRYGWIGMILSNVLPFKIKQIDKWYCSEWVAHALLYANVLDQKAMQNYNRSGITPSDLYKILKYKLY